MHGGKNIGVRVRQFQVQILDLPLTKLFTFLGKSLTSLALKDTLGIIILHSKSCWEDLNVYIDIIAHPIVVLKIGNCFS